MDQSVIHNNLWMLWYFTPGRATSGSANGTVASVPLLAVEFDPVDMMSRYIVVASIEAKELFL